MKINYIIYVVRGKKTDKLIFKDKKIFEFYRKLLNIQNIKYSCLEVFCYDE